MSRQTLKELLPQWSQLWIWLNRKWSLWVHSLQDKWKSQSLRSCITSSQEEESWRFTVLPTWTKMALRLWCVDFQLLERQHLDLGLIREKSSVMMKFAGETMDSSTLKEVSMLKSITWRKRLNLKFLIQSNSDQSLRTPVSRLEQDKSTLLMCRLQQTPELHSHWTTFPTLICLQLAHIQRTSFSWHVTRRAFCHQSQSLPKSKPFTSSFQVTLRRSAVLILLQNRQNPHFRHVLERFSCHWTPQSMQRCCRKRSQSITLTFGWSTQGNLFVKYRWINGRYGVGRRIDFKDSLAMVDAINEGRLDNVPTYQSKFFNFNVPTSVPGLDPKLLHP